MEKETLCPEMTEPQESGAESAEGAETITEPSKNEILIPVKFNKEIKNLTADEAAQFAQKGMKFDAILDDYNRIRALAAKNGGSVSKFLNTIEEMQNNKRKQELLQGCAGNEELAEHIMRLEGMKTGEEGGFEELKKEFPEIKSIEEIPETVRETSIERGTDLLDEYLRYLHKCSREAEDAERRQKEAKRASIGSQRAYGSPENPEATEFLKGLWG